MRTQIKWIKSCIRCFGFLNILNIKILANVSWRKWFALNGILIKYRHSFSCERVFSVASNSFFYTNCHRCSPLKSFNRFDNGPANDQWFRGKNICQPVVNLRDEREKKKCSVFSVQPEERKCILCWCTTTVRKCYWVKQWLNNAR